MNLAGDLACLASNGFVRALTSPVALAVAVRVLLLLVLSAGFHPSVVSADPPAPPHGKKWVLVWSDDFNGGSLDMSKWSLRGEASRQARLHDGHRIRWRYEDDNVWVEDGKLVLQNTRVSPFYEEGDLVKAAAVASKGRYERTYGYFEASIRIAPTVDGVHTAFWLQNDNRRNTAATGGLNGPADGAEIDILESAYTNGKYGVAVHWDAGRTISQRLSFPPMHDGRFHVFGLEWTPERYWFYADGRLKHSTAHGVSQSDGYVILSTGLSWWGGNAHTGTFPNRALVDWVKVYELRDEREPNLPQTGQPTITGIPAVGHTLAASAANIADEDGLTNAAFTLQWLADDGVAAAEIPGATEPSYTLTSADAGKTIKVRVSYTDDNGFDERATSPATAEVAWHKVARTAWEADENTTTIAQLATVGDTGSGGLVWSMPEGAGGADADADDFTLSADGVLAFKAGKDFETPDDANGDGIYEVPVRVSGGGGSTDALVTVRVWDVNEAPIVDAGPDAVVSAGTQVTLDGTRSRDPDADDALTYRWTQTKRTRHATTLSDPAAQAPTFIAEPVGRPVALGFTLRVTDSQGLYSKDTVTVTVQRSSIVSIRPAASHVEEGADPVFVLTRFGDDVSALTVRVTAEESGVMLARAVPSGAVFEEGKYETELRVPTVDDAVHEDNSEVAARLEPGFAYVVSNPRGTASVTVMDDDPRPPGAVLWSANMSVTDFGSAVGSGGADSFWNLGGNGDLRVKWLWYAADGTLRLGLSRGLRNPGEVTLHMDEIALAIPRSVGGNSSVRFRNVDLDWAGGDTIVARLIRFSGSTASRDASLVSLEVSDTGLDPGFDPGGLVYAAAAGPDTASVTVSAVPADRGASVAVTPADADDGLSGHQVPLGVGETLVTIMVTAADGVTRRAYQVVVTRPEATATVSFGSAYYIAVEGGTAAVAVRLSQDPKRETVIPLTATPGDGVGTEDYQVADSVTFTAGGPLWQTVTVTAANDETEEDGESVVLGFGAMPGAWVKAGKQATAGVDFEDGDGAPAVTDVGEAGDRTVTNVAITSSPGDDGFYGIGDVVTIEVDFNGPVTVEPTPFVSMDLYGPTAGGSEGTVRGLLACYAEGSGTSTLTFRHAVRQSVGGWPSLAALLSNDPGDPSMGALYSGSRDNLVALDFEATAADRRQAFDGLRPVLRSTTLSSDRTRIVLTFSESLSSATAPVDAFRVTVGDTEAEVSTVSVSGRDLTLTLAAPAGTGKPVEVAYDEPTPIDPEPPPNAPANDPICGLDFVGDDTHAVQDLAGNDGYGLNVVVDRGAPLTATFEGVPSENEPGDAFTFELHFSEDIEGLGYRTVREALWVRNGRVRRAQRLAKGSNQGWRVKIQPTRTGDITILLPARACGESLAVCTADGRALSEQVVAEVRSTRFMAWLSASPREHDGETEFTLMLGLNVQPQGLSYRTVRDGLFDVNGGQVTEARRTRQDSSRLWLVTLAPTSTADMSITVRGTDSCEAEHAVCTEDGRRLRSGPSVTISGPPVVTVADGRAAEGEDGTLDFTVSVSRAATGPVTVAYATSDGTATAGQDYTAASGTLTFAAGELTKTVSVTVLNDAYDEGEETFTLTLSNVTGGAYLADATATGTITNSDPLQRAWLARFGRTAATHVVDAVGERLRGPGQAPSQVTIGGYRLPLGQSPAGGAKPGATADSLAAVVTGLAGVVGLRPTRPGPGGPGTDPWAEQPGPDRRLSQTRPGGLPDVRLRHVLPGSSFRLTLGSDDAGTRPRLTAWGRVAGTQFDGRDGDLTLDGDVLTGTVGVDGAWDRWLAGVAVAHSRGDGSYTVPDTGVGGQGDLENTLTSIHPYLRYAVTERLNVWGVLGYGRGDLTLEPGTGSSLETDTALVMGAFGGRGILLAAEESSGFQLATRTEAMLTRTTSDAAAGLASAEADAHRLRLVLEGSRGFKWAEGRSLTPTVELGLRHDWGDAETGFGLEVGGRVQYADPALGLTIEGAVRGLLAHEDRDYEEWGASGTLRIDPGDGGQGLALTLSPAWGATASGVEGLWSRQTTAGLAPATQRRPGGRLNAEVGYGLAAPFGAGLLTPYAGAVLAEGGERTYRVGGRWAGMAGLQVSLEGLRQEPAGSRPAEKGAEVRATWGF